MMRKKPLLISCGILRSEVECLVRANDWQLDTLFLKSSLHFDFDQLEQSLTATMKKHAGREMTVAYGVCHPLMDRIVSGYGALRLPCQNCVEMLLGSDVFTGLLSKGAYFLLEEWALNWDDIMRRTFGGPAVTREIFRSDRRMLVAVKTPCSGDFAAAAESAAKSVGVPLEWLTVDLSHLESYLVDTLGKQAGAKP